MKTDKHYVSKIDQKLTEFDQTHPKSAAQQAEIKKHQRVYEQRDNPTLPAPEEEDFFA